MGHSPFGASYGGNLPRHMFAELFSIHYLDDECNSGKSFRTWAATPSNDSIWKKEYAPMNSANKDATSFADLQTTLENHNDLTRSTPSTELSPFGKPNVYENPCLFEHLGFWHLTGHNNYDVFSLHTPSRPKITTLRYKYHPLASCSPSTPRSWTAFATTRKLPHNGHQEKSHPAYVLYFADLPNPSHLMTTTLCWTATSYTSRMGHSLLLQQAHFTTKIFPPSKEIYKVLLSALSTWTTRNSLPSPHRNTIDELWSQSLTQHHSSLRNHITHKDITRFKQQFPNAVFHNEDKRATSLRIYCPIIYHRCLSATFADPLVFKKLEDSPNQLIAQTIADIKTQFGKQYPWALGTGKDLPNAYVLPKRKKQFLAGRPIVSFFTAPFRPMLNCIAKMIYHLLPKAFFTSIDTDRFIDSWRLTLKFLSSTMSTTPDEIISVKATPTNTTGDVVKGRTCRTLNLTRKIFIRDIERIILMSLKMTQFSIGTSVYAQIRGSPMGSPLSPALCMMVVALSEEIWYQTYSTTLATMDLSSRLLRYVDNRLCLADPSWDYEICFANFLHPEFYGKPIILETEPDQEFLGFCIEFEPFALRYSPPRDFNQVMAPFSASPLTVQLSGFVSRLFLVAKCAHPTTEQARGFAALHRLYRKAGFSETDLVSASKPIRKYLHTKPLW